MNEFREKLKEFQHLEPRSARVAAFHFVRDIAYGDIGSRNPHDVLKRKKGTCSGKHALLKLFLEGLGYEVQTWFAKHDFSTFPIFPWPDELMEFKGKTLTDYHDFLKVKVNDEWLTVDAIFDAVTARFGFPVTEWDGTSSIELPIRAENIFQTVEDPEERKKYLIAELPRDVQKNRKAFLQALTRMLDAKRS